MPVPIYLALKEIWRNKARYLLVSSVVALITTLVLFIAGLTEGLGLGNRELLANLQADLILYQTNVDLSVATSKIAWSTMRQISRVEGVKAVGPLGFSPVSIILNGEPLKITLVGLEPGKPGEPSVYEGRNLMGSRTEETIIDRGVVVRTGLKVGDTITLKSSVGLDEKFYRLKVAGICDSQQYSIQPSIFVPYITWEKIKPKLTDFNPNAEVIFNIVAVQLDQPQEKTLMVNRLQNQLNRIQAVDVQTAYEPRQAINLNKVPWIRKNILLC